MVYSFVFFGNFELPSPLTEPRNAQKGPLIKIKTKASAGSYSWGLGLGRSTPTRQ
jgi:hypothetical protein